LAFCELLDGKEWSGVFAKNCPSSHPMAVSLITKNSKVTYLTGKSV